MCMTAGAKVGQVTAALTRCQAGCPQHIQSAHEHHWHAHQALICTDLYRAGSADARHASTLSPSKARTALTSMCCAVLCCRLSTQHPHHIHTARYAAAYSTQPVSSAQHGPAHTQRAPTDAPNQPANNTLPLFCCHRTCTSCGLTCWCKPAGIGYGQSLSSRGRVFCMVTTCPVFHLHMGPIGGFTAHATHMFTAHATHMPWG